MFGAAPIWYPEASTPLLPSQGPYLPEQHLEPWALTIITNVIMLNIKQGAENRGSPQATRKPKGTEPG